MQGNTFPWKQAVSLINWEVSFQEISFQSWEVRGCSQLMSAKNDGVQNPRFPPLSVKVSISPTPLPPLSAYVSISPSPLCRSCQHFPDPTPLFDLAVLASYLISPSSWITIFCVKKIQYLNKFDAMSKMSLLKINRVSSQINSAF